MQLATTENIQSVQELLHFCNDEGALMLTKRRGIKWADKAVDMDLLDFIGSKQMMLPDTPLPVLVFFYAITDDGIALMLKGTN